ncbi:aminotransferase class V-fold PLP-dependent enzyme [Sporolactobacillus sp. THM7-7]|nr:aminotransferase class V-fold PLP-dependent enzyme [Sporolactobacillus sp. THM7-7]
MIYLDYAATTPLSEHALTTYGEVSRKVFANTMSLHDDGSRASRLLELCRRNIAERLNADANGIYFTSGGSESNQLAIEGLARAHAGQGKHLIMAEGEHTSVVSTFEKLKKDGFSVTVLPRNSDGEITAKAVEKAVRKETILVSVDHVNSETGAIQNIAAIGDILRKRKILFHCDTVQSYGKLPIDVRAMHVTSLSVSSHKIYGPKGVGVCYINPKAAYQPLYPGTAHERGVRPGTVNLPGIAAFVTASQDSYEKAEKNIEYVRRLRKIFVDGLNRRKIHFVMEQAKHRQLPHILALRIKGVEGQQLMLAANRRGLAVSTGSACQAGSHRPSPTLLSMGRSEDEARELVRVSFGETTTEEEADRAARLFAEAVSETVQTMRMEQSFI